MAQALLLAEEAASAGEVPVGAVIVRDGGQVAAGRNQMIAARDPTAHAEMNVLRAAARRLENYRLPDCELFVTIEPCCMCAGALLHARIGRLVFGAKEPRAGALVSRLQLLDSRWLNHRVQVRSGVLEDSCGRLMTDFFAARRRSAT